MSDRFRSNRLEPIVNLARHGEQEAAGRLGGIRQALLDAESQMLRLQQYRKEYLEQLQQGQGTSCSAGMLRHCRQFIARIDAAIEQQSNKVQELRSRLEEATSLWHQKRARRTAINKAQDKMRQDELKEKQRQEQKETDDDNVVKAARGAGLFFGSLGSAGKISKDA
jgi:flagellar export protein FliJ